MNFFARDSQDESSFLMHKENKLSTRKKENSRRTVENKANRKRKWIDGPQSDQLSYAWNFERKKIKKNTERKSNQAIKFDVDGQNAYSVRLSEQVSINVMHVFTQKKEWIRVIALNEYMDESFFMLPKCVIN